MPTVRAKSPDLLGLRLGVDELPQDLQNRLSKAYRAFDGTILHKSVAEARVYPLGQQPVEVQAFMTRGGTMVEVRTGDWIIVNQETDQMLVVGGEEFAEGYEIVTNQGSVSPT